MLLRLLINIEGLLVRTVIPCYTYTCLDIAGWVRGDKGWSQAVPWRERKVQRRGVVRLHFFLLSFSVSFIYFWLHCIAFVQAFLLW